VQKNDEQKHHSQEADDKGQVNEKAFYWSGLHHDINTARPHNVEQSLQCT